MLLCCELMDYLKVHFVLRLSPPLHIHRFSLADYAISEFYNIKKKNISCYYGYNNNSTYEKKVFFLFSYLTVFLKQKYSYHLVHDFFSDGRKTFCVFFRVGYIADSGGNSFVRFLCVGYCGHLRTSADICGHGRILAGMGENRLSFCEHQKTYNGIIT